MMPETKKPKMPQPVPQGMPSSPPPPEAPSRPKSQKAKSSRGKQPLLEPLGAYPPPPDMRPWSPPVVGKAKLSRTPISDIHWWRPLAAMHVTLPEQESERVKRIRERMEETK